ncbi:MAG: leucine-rich repeat domain-containing protein [Solobacterium sp.]|nr:leucine-rich repeat domain-containing protein [Solobacterium sp.]
MAYYKILDTALTAIANAIRSKTGRSAALTPAQMVTEINSLPDEEPDALLSRILQNNRTYDIETSAPGVKDYTFYNAKIGRFAALNAARVGIYAFSHSLVSDLYFPVADTLWGYSFEYCTELTTLTAAMFPVLQNLSQYVFWYCTGLVSVVLPAVTTIGQYTFAYDTALETAEFEGATTVSYRAFHQDTALARVKLGGTSIAAQVFAGCTSLTQLVMGGTTVPSLANVNAFDGTPIAAGAGYIYVPDALVSAYKAATNWATFAAQIKPVSELA